MHGWNQILYNQNTYQNVHSCKLTNRYGKSNNFDGIYQEAHGFSMAIC